MDRIGKKAGITGFPASAHKLPHTVNVIARRAGLDQYTRSALLGPRQYENVARYDHLVPDELHEARERREEALSRYVSRARQPEWAPLHHGDREAGCQRLNGKVRYVFRNFPLESIHAQAFKAAEAAECAAEQG